MTPKVSLSTTAHLFNYEGAAEMAKECGYDAIEAVAIKGSRKDNELKHALALGLGVTIHLPIASDRSKNLSFSRRYIQKPVYGKIESCNLLYFARNYTIPCVVHASTLASMSTESISGTFEFLQARIENEQAAGSIGQQLRTFKALKESGWVGMMFTGLTVDIGHAMIEGNVPASSAHDAVDDLICTYAGYPVEEVHASRVFSRGENLADHGLWPDSDESGEFIGEVARFVRAFKAETVVFEFYPGHATALQLNFGCHLQWFEEGVRYAAETMKAALANG